MFGLVSCKGSTRRCCQGAVARAENHVYLVQSQHYSSFCADMGLRGAPSMVVHTVEHLGDPDDGAM